MLSPQRSAEWRRYWPMPIVAMLGVSGSGAYSFASGVFMEPVTTEFGWSRTEFASAFTFQVLMGLIVLPVVGRLIDRFGPRRVALAGIVPFVMTFSLFANANGELWQWYVFSLLLTIGLGCVAPTVWIAGVVRGFEFSRGIAIAFAVAGMGVATAIWPLAAAFYIDILGWRLAFPAMALSWGIVLLPLTFFFFRPPAITEAAFNDEMPASPSVKRILRTPLFLGLLAAACLFGFIQLGLIAHFVPILLGEGMDLPKAAGLAGIVGLASIAGRLGTGVLLDLLPTRPVAIGAFALLLPVLALLMLVDATWENMLVVAVLLGLAAGAEMDALTYIVSKRFEPRVFGSTYSFLQAGLAICSSLGPLTAGRIFDVSASYDGFILLCVPFNLAAVLILALVLIDGPARPNMF